MGSRGGDGEFSAALRRAREAAALSQQELAERAGVTVQAISQLERGVRRRPYPHTVRALADGLGLVGDARTAFLAAVPRRQRAVEPRAEPPAEPPVRGAPRPGPPPGPPTALVGRDEDVVAVVAALEFSRLVTLTGPGGVGKTSLALEVARGLAPDFPDGAAVVDLSTTRDPDRVAGAVARALAVSEEATPEATTAVVAAAFAARRMLLVLDNLEHLLEAADVVAALVAAADRGRVLATSRAPLRLRGEREHPVAPLALPRLDHLPRAEEVLAAPSARLFAARARDHDPGFAVTDEEAATVAAICRRLDGLPLAVELAAAWLRVLSPTELLARLDRALPLLSDGARDLPARQRTMRDAVAWSHDLLDPDDRRRFRRLAAFPGAFTLEAAGAVLDEPPDAVLAGVARLVERSLVMRRPAPDGATFALLETIRAFGVEQLVAAREHDEVRTAHASWVLDVALAADVELEGADQRRWLGRVTALRDDVAAAVAWWRATDARAAGRLVWALRWWWYVHAPGEARRLIGELVDELPAEEAVRCRALLALLAFAGGDVAAARAAGRQALAAAEGGGDEDAVVFAVGALTLALSASGDPAAAADVLAARQPVVDRLARPLPAVVFRLLLTRFDLDRGDVEGARARLDDAAAALRDVDTPWARAFWCNLATTIAVEDGRVDDALSLLRTGVALSRELEDVAALAYALAALGELLAALGRGEDAARVFGATETFERRHGVTGAETTVLDEATVRRHALLHGLAARDLLGDAWRAGAEAPLDDILAAVLGPAPTR